MVIAAQPIANEAIRFVQQRALMPGASKDDQSTGVNALGLTIAAIGMSKGLGDIPLDVFLRTVASLWNEVKVIKDSTSSPSKEKMS